MAETVEDVVSSGLCVACGTCLVICPVAAITMTETPAGLLQATVSAACTACGKCTSVCPGRQVDFGLGAHVDPFRGEVLGVFVGRAIDPAVGTGAQSGGVVSALLLHQLRYGESAAALTTYLPFDGRLRPMARLARTPDAVLQARGSKYTPVATNAALLGLAEGERATVVGVSCQLQGLHRLTTTSPQWATRIDCTIGLLCDRTLLYLLNDVLARDVGLDARNLVALELRSTLRRGWPGEVCFHLGGESPRFYPSSLRVRAKDFVTPPRCRLCFDKANILADLSVGDPWGLPPSGKAESVVIARTERGLCVLNAAVENGSLELREIDLGVVLEGQGMGRRARNFAGYSAAWAAEGRLLPEYTGLGAFRPIDIDDKAMRTYRKQLEFNCRIAEMPNRDSALSTIRRNRRWAATRAKAGLILQSRLLQGGNWSKRDQSG